MVSDLPLVCFEFFATLILFSNLAVEVVKEEQQVVIFIQIGGAQYLFMIFTHKVVDGFDGGQIICRKALLATPKLRIMTLYFHSTEICT